MKRKAGDVDFEPMVDQDGEYLPPLGLRESWPMAWERELAATSAWQEARAAQDSAYAAYRTPTLQALLKLHSALGSAEEQLQRMRSDAAELAASEMERNASELYLTRPVATPAAQRIHAIVQGAQDLLASLSRELRATAAQSRALPFERRHEARVINFPDRRRAA